MDLPQPSNKEEVGPLPDALRREEMSLQLTFGKRRKLLSTKTPRPLGKSPSPLKRIEGSSLRVREDKAPPISKRRARENRAPLPRHRQEMSSCALQVGEEIAWQVLYGSISKKHRAPSNFTGKKRAPSAFSSTRRKRRVLHRPLFIFER